jgi:hypothetical protein
MSSPPVHLQSTPRPALFRRRHPTMASLSFLSFWLPHTHPSLSWAPPLIPLRHHRSPNPSLLLSVLSGSVSRWSHTGLLLPHLDPSTKVTDQNWPDWVQGTGLPFNNYSWLTTHNSFTHFDAPSTTGVTIISPPTRRTPFPPPSLPWSRPIWLGRGSRHRQRSCWVL